MRDVLLLSTYYMSNPFPSPSHKMVALLSYLHWLSRSWLEMVLGQNILFILRRFLLWKVDSFWRAFSVVRQHSDLYSRVDRTQLWSQLGVGAVLGRPPDVLKSL